MAKEDVLLFGCYGARGTGKSYYEKLKEKDIEIERLKEKNEELRALYFSEREVKEDYKSKVNKAIEYIETYKESFKNYIASDLEFNVNKLLDILKEKEEER